MQGMDWRAGVSGAGASAWLGLSVVIAGPCLAQDAADAGQPVPAGEPPQRVFIIGSRPVDVGPMPGLAIGKDQIPANVQSVTRQDLKASRALNIGEHMNAQLQGVSITDYAGNPFQMDLNYRGFTASPQVGTPQGLSVFFDGVRVNEPFGDVVNWDLIPTNAIERFDVFPGSNPLFGLNTLGGAVSVRGRSGYSSHGWEGNALAGAFGRRQVQLSGGGAQDGLAGFAAVNAFHEDGWRDDSPSDVGQFYGRADYALEDINVNLSVLAAHNDLVGNGLVPAELARQRAQTVFTSPDATRNRLLQLSAGLIFDLDERRNVTMRVYHRSSDRSGLGGDFYEGFDDFSDTNGLDVVVDPQRPVGEQTVTRNGAMQYGLVGGNIGGTGVIEGTPIGVLTRTALRQRTMGLSAQYNVNAPDHKLMVGGSLDSARSTYLMTQRLGLIDARHRVYGDAAGIDPIYYAGANDVPGNDFSGRQDIYSLYASDTWSPAKTLHLTAAARFNQADTFTRLYSRASAAQRALHELYTSNAQIDELVNAKELTQERFRFTSLNPSFGAAWNPMPEAGFYANLGRGSRAPSVVELGCAFDDTPVTLTNGQVVFGTVPRSLLGPGCSLPTTLSGDPYLPQIRSTSGELGARGQLAGAWSWNLSVYRTDLTNDIYFVGVGDGKSFFDTVGKTRRQGMELGLSGRLLGFDLKASYSYNEATFQSVFYTLSPHNSSADFDQNSQAISNLPDLGDATQTAPSPTATANGGRGTYRQTRIDPGARMPGIPLHAFNASLAWSLGDAFKLSLGMQARSSTFVRGNENNQHQPAGTDRETGLYYCTGTGCVEGMTQSQVRPGRPFTNNGRLPGYALFNLDVSARVADGWRVYAQVANLFDRRYSTAGRLGVNPFSPGQYGAIGPSGWNYNSAEWQNSTYVSPGAPRGVWLGIECEFGGP